MKILDRYIIVSYLRTFFSVFIILMLIFVLQSIWLYITELAGKELELDIIGKFLVFVTPRLVVLVLPLTILLSSIMVFGGFAENYEFAAMKSTGISLQRAMRSLGVFIVGLAITLFFFANNVIPAAELSFHNLRRNIAKVKPAMAIAEGQFNQIGSINIKVDKKSGERGQFLETVVIHQKKGTNPGNYTVIMAKSGELASSINSDVLQLILYDGNYYDEIQPKKFEERQKLPHVKSWFEKYTLNVDLSQINNVDFEDEDHGTKHTMLTVGDLDYTIDSLLVSNVKGHDDFAINMYNRSTAATLSKNISPARDVTFKDDDFLSLFNDQSKVQVLNLALNSVKSTQQIVTVKEKNFENAKKNLNVHVISLNEKFAIPIACVILFFIGAPLGALIRKGGLGLPILIATALFLIYHFIGIFAKNSASDGSLNPAFATWLSTLIMLPLSIYLTNRATKDLPLFNLDGIIDPLKKLFYRPSPQNLDHNSLLEEGSEAYKKLLDETDKQLIKIVKNYRQYGLDISHKNTALGILDSRGITEQELKFGGNLTNENYDNALRFKTSFEEHGSVTIFFYIMTLLMVVGGLVLRNNGFESTGTTLIVIGIPFAILFLVMLIKTFAFQSSFYKVLEKNNAANILLLILLGIPVFFVYFIIFKTKIKEDLKQIR